MERKVLIGLIQGGMRFPVGRHLVWFSRCFEITVHPGRMVEVDEYEGLTEKDPKAGPRAGNGASASARMFHIGRSVLHLKRGWVREEAGVGWSVPQESRNGFYPAKQGRDGR